MEGNFFSPQKQEKTTRTQKLHAGTIN